MFIFLKMEVLWLFENISKNILVRWLDVNISKMKIRWLDVDGCELDWEAMWVM